ncbi:hypothetical protein C8R44DRAFT_892838 [Mycena epipterygia]|nr:hypothetical protein C8R44DRAFT_892838 [Mycena epipterygia]
MRDSDAEVKAESAALCQLKTAPDATTATPPRFHFHFRRPPKSSSDDGYSSTFEDHPKSTSDDGPRSSTFEDHPESTSDDHPHSTVALGLSQSQGAAPSETQSGSGVGSGSALNTGGAGRVGASAGLGTGLMLVGMALGAFLL